MGAAIRTTTGPVLEKPGDAAAILTALNKGDVLFIDEIHRMNPVVEEILYPAMEDYCIDVMIGEGPSARSIRLTLEHFTLIGATTRQGLLGSPFRDRFGIVMRLNLYSAEDLEEIVKRSAAILKIPITPEGAAAIAARSRGTPRIANRLLRRVRDYATVKGNGEITKEIAEDGLSLLRIDELGLGRDRPPDPHGDRGRFLRWAGRRQDDSDLGWRRGPDHRGGLRAVSHPDRVCEAHPAGPGDNTRPHSPTSGSKPGRRRCSEKYRRSSRFFRKMQVAPYLKTIKQTGKI